MEQQHVEMLEASRLIAQRDGVIDFKDEGENEAGLTFGKLTLRSSTASVYPDDRWVTRRAARQIAEAWGVELFEY